MSDDEKTWPERRAYERFPLQGRAQIEFEERRYFLTENVVEASAAGLFVTSAQEAFDGEKITFDLRVTPEGPVYSGSGEVTWVRAPEEMEEDDRPPGFGVRFFRIDPQGAQLLLELSEAFAEGGQDALDERLAAAVEAWKAGEGGEEEETADLEDTEALLKDTQEMTPLDEADTDPLVVPPDDLGDSPAGSDHIETQELPGLDDEDESSWGHDDRDVLSKTLDVGGSRSVKALREKSASRSPVPIWPVLLTAGLLVGGILWITAPAPDAAASRTRVAEETPQVTDPGDEAEVDGATAPPEAAAALAAPAENGDGPTFRGIQDITWRTDGEALVVTIELDGRIPENGYVHFRPGNDPPREVVQIFDVADKFVVSEIEVDSSLVERIRVGNHLTEEGSEDRVVLDLGSEEVQLRSIEPQGDRLVLRLTADRVARRPGPSD